jgi:hypothetical protein
MNMVNGAGVVYTVMVLGIVAAGISVAAVFWRFISTRREARVDHIRARMLQLMRDFLEDKVERRTVIKEMHQNRNIALQMLVGMATELPTPQRERLHVFFDHFRFEQQQAEVLRSRSWLKRTHAASELGLSGERTATPELTAALKDPTFDVRLAAAQSLAQMRVPESVIAITQALTEKPDWPTLRAAEILNLMGPSAIEPVLKFLGEQRREILQQKTAEPAVLIAVRVIGLLRAMGGLPIVRELLSHPDPELRLMSARSLGQLGDLKSGAPLAEALNDPVWEVRCIAAQALGRLADVTAIPALARCLGDPEWWVRFNAADALSQMDGPGVKALKAQFAGRTDGLAHDVSRQILQEHGIVSFEEVATP